VKPKCLSFQTLLLQVLTKCFTIIIIIIIIPMSCEVLRVVHVLYHTRWSWSYLLNTFFHKSQGRIKGKRFNVAATFKKDPSKDVRHTCWVPINVFLEMLRTFARLRVALYKVQHIMHTLKGTTSNWSWVLPLRRNEFIQPHIWSYKSYIYPPKQVRRMEYHRQANT
jgi:hypothetical protein